MAMRPHFNGIDPDLSALNVEVERILDVRDREVEVEMTDDEVAELRAAEQDQEADADNGTEVESQVTHSLRPCRPPPRAALCDIIALSRHAPPLSVFLSRTEKTGTGRGFQDRCGTDRGAVAWKHPTVERTATKRAGSRCADVRPF
jgi:hypothetical protein